MRKPAALAVLVVLLPACSGGGGGAERARSAPDADRVYEVERLDLSFTDEARGRDLPTKVWHPAAVEDGPFPVVLFSHGFTGAAIAYQNAATALASEGYVVVAPDYPLTKRSAVGGPQLLDVRSQPADVSFLLDRVTAELDDLADVDRVAVAGHSLGAITSLMVGLNTCCRDERVDAVVSLAGAATLEPLGGQWFDGPATPVLFVHGDGDELVLHSLGLQAYSRAEAPKAFVTLLGADHSLAFLGSKPWFPVWTRAVVDFLDATLDGRAEGWTRLRRHAEVPGVAALESVGLPEG
jgi:dienelactone hydrolase